MRFGAGAWALGCVWVTATRFGGGGRVVAADLPAEQPDRDGGREQEGDRAGVEPPAAAAGDGYQPETFHISFFSRAASAPAAARKSSPESRKA